MSDFISHHDFTHRGVRIRLSKYRKSGYIVAWIVSNKDPSRRGAPLSIPNTTSYPDARDEAKRALDAVSYRRN